MSLIILPTYGVVRDFHRGAAALDMLDYDLDEHIQIILDALLYPDWYPNSFYEIVSIDSGDCRPHYPPDKIAGFNALLEMLYSRIYAAIMSSGLYSNGALQHTFFCVYDHDIALSEDEIPGPLGEQQW